METNIEMYLLDNNEIISTTPEIPVPSSSGTPASPFQTPMPSPSRISVLSSPRALVPPAPAISLSVSSDNTNQTNDNWNSGYKCIAGIILGFCILLGVLSTVQSLYPDDVGRITKYLMPILYAVVGVATNLAAGIAYGKPYLPFYLSIFCWTCSIVIYIKAPTWWDLSEKLSSLSLPIVIMVRYFWKGLRRHAEAQ